MASVPTLIYFLLVGCFVLSEGERCSVSLPQNASPSCKQLRKSTVAQRRSIYQSTIKKGLLPPLLNMTIPKVIEVLGDDPFAKYHLQLLITIGMFNKELFKLWHKTEKADYLTNVEGFKNTSEFFLSRTLQYGGKYFQIPTHEETFRDTFRMWNSDKFFVEQRLAGNNCNSLQLVSYGTSVGLHFGSKLNPFLNSKFNWDAAITKALGRKITLQSAIHQGLVYALRYPLCDKLETAKTDFTDADPTRSIMPFHSPITLFVVKHNTKEHENQLVPVAIQVDHEPDSSVYTPEDKDLWTMAKLNVQLTDLGHNQFVEHLLNVHFLMEPFCVSLERHLSKDHPLHQILKFHCRGLSITNTFGYPSLLGAGQSADKLLAFGRIGVLELINNGYKEAGWEVTDFYGKIKKRGLDDDDAVPYFPYRDDGRLIYDEIEAMVTDYVNIYYKTSVDVLNDKELQSYVNEISSDGKGPNGGRGMLKRFPNEVTSKHLLVEIVTRVIAQFSIQHASVNYPLVDYAVLPITPTKLYNDPNIKQEEFGFRNFPNSLTSGIQSAFTSSLGTLRYDSLFDYSDQLRDRSARKIVHKYYCRLRDHVEPLLMKKNSMRMRDGHLTYPYFLPRWLPNSVQT